MNLICLTCITIFCCANLLLLLYIKYMSKFECKLLYTLTLSSGILLYICSPCISFYGINTATDRSHIMGMSLLTLITLTAITGYWNWINAINLRV